MARPATDVVNYWSRWNCGNRQHGMGKYQFFIRVNLGQGPCVSARHCRQFIQLYQKTVYGSEVAFCIWRLGCCSRLVFHYFHWEKGFYCCKGLSYCRVSWLCNLHYKMAVPPWPELICLTCLTLENGDITGFRTSTNMHLNIQRRNSDYLHI